MSGRPRGKVLILGLNYAPEAIGIGPYTTGLAEWFAAGGHKVQVIAGRPYYPQWRAHEGYGPCWKRAIERGVEIIRCPHYIPRRLGGFRRVVHHASFALASLGPMLRAAHARPKVVVAIAPSLLSVPVAWFAALLAGAKLWLHVQDFEVDAAQATGLLRRGSWLTRIGRAAERFLLRRADLVTTISPQMCRQLAAKGVAESRVAELRNWANHLDAIAAASGDALRQQWGLNGQFVALYSGNIANKQGLEIVIQAARLLEAEERIAFVICGEGPNRLRLEALADGLGNVTFHGLQPTDRFASLMRMADCHLLPQVAEAADLVLPSKLANMLASARPVVATAAAGTGIAEEIEGCGLVVPPGDAVALAEAIRSLANKPARAQEIGQIAAQRAQAHWRKEAVLAQADRLLDRLITVKDTA